MNQEVIFDHIINELHLGALTAPPQRVTGGFMHKMFQLETTTGNYAVKLLNSTIMKRPDALDNYKRAEGLESILQQNQIPCVPALEIEGRKMHCIDGQYFYVFNWIEGKSVLWEHLTRKHCEIAGALLAKIHKIEQTDTPFEPDEIRVDWDTYIAQAEAKCPEIASDLANNRDLLYSAQEQYNLALKSLPPITTICDGDMDCKNVLWTEGKPLIIDLECLDYGNPVWEMFRLALDWSGDVICKINFDHLGAFLSAYQKEYDHSTAKMSIDWNALYGLGFGWLDWLDYNVRRALMLECSDEEERKLGIEQVLGTIPRIVYYDSIRAELLNHLSKQNETSS